MALFGKKEAAKKPAKVARLDLGPATGVTLAVDEKFRRIQEVVNQLVAKVNK